MLGLRKCSGAMPYHQITWVALSLKMLFGGVAVRLDLSLLKLHKALVPKLYLYSTVSQPDSLEGISLAKVARARQSQSFREKWRRAGEASRAHGGACVRPVARPKPWPSAVLWLRDLGLPQC